MIILALDFITLTHLIEHSQINIFPNPFTTSTTLEIKSQFINPKSPIIFEMYDIFGRKIKQQEIKNSKAEIPRGNLPSGIYFYKVSNLLSFGGGWGEVIGTGKLVVE